MQEDFDFVQQDSSTYEGWLEKQGNVIKKWKPRYFILGNESIKYYTTKPTNNSNLNEPKGEYLLCGSQIQRDGTTIILKLADEKKSIYFLRAENEEMCNLWVKQLSEKIELSNIKALLNGRRIPEIIEWYYQYQSELFAKCNFLSDELEISLCYSAPGKLGVKTNSNFKISMTEDKTGLLLSIMSDIKRFNRYESVNNGRIIYFIDINGVYIPSGEWNVDKNNRFQFHLQTKEDKLTIETNHKGIAWLEAVKKMTIFSKIPKPTARSSVDNSIDNFNSFIEFNSNSGAVFVISSDVQLILEGFPKLTKLVSNIEEIGKRVNTILKLIPDMKFNREAGLIFGERIEEMVRVLADYESGILMIANESHKTLLSFHLSTFNNKLNDIISFLENQSKPGWLSVCLNKPNESNKTKFEMFDSDLINIVNILIKSISFNPTSLFDKKEYSMAVSLRQSVEALGGIEAIYNDSAKERALSKLIQSDSKDIHQELESILIDMESNIRSLRNSNTRFISLSDSEASQQNLGEPLVKKKSINSSN